jgi:hypothetical protein
MTSILKTNAIEPEGATTNMVVGESGQNTVISNNDLRANVLQDAGGNAVFTSNGSGVLSGVNSGFGSAMVLLSTQTASGSASLSFTSGIDSTYGEYIFKFYNINPATDQATFQFNGSIDGGSNYNVTKTTTMFHAYHDEANSATGLAYEASYDHAQQTGDQILIAGIGNGADESGVGVLHLFNPSSTTYVKHFYANINGYLHGDYTHNAIPAGYFNTTSAIDAVTFKMNSGNFDGTIKMWGVK